MNLGKIKSKFHTRKSKFMKTDLDLRELNGWLGTFANFERKPDSDLWNLETVSELAEYFGHPERASRVFHITGSKGKGTIAANIAAILRNAGYKVGVHSSPYVDHFVERVWDGERAFPQEVYDAAYRTLRSGVEELEKRGKMAAKTVTFHELLTIYTALVFKEARCDFAVWEVDAGGRLDSTNIVQPEICVFGPIELEHTKFLGDTLAKIAFEKAGIIKEKVSVISVSQEEEVAEVLETVATEKSTKVEFLPPMDDYMKMDAEIAKRAVLKVLPKMRETEMDEVISKVKLPGRYEWCKDGTILIDVAHTPNSIKVVTKRMKKDGVSGNLIFGCAEDKKVEEMAKILQNCGIFKRVYLTRPGDFKQSDLPRMEKAFRMAGFLPEVEADFDKMIRRAVRESIEEKETLIVLGSFFLASEVKKRI